MGTLEGTPSLLVRDFEGKFAFCDMLSKVGYLVDQILPEALKHVTVGDHDLYIFSFQSEENMQRALKIVGKLKQAKLPTPIFLLNFSPPSPDFLNHQKAEFAANGYLAAPRSENVILDSLDRLVGSPVPSSLKGRLQFLQADQEQKEVVDSYRKKIQDLQNQLNDIEGAKGDSLDKALSAQRSMFKPKLDAMLKGQELQHQTETEQLKFALSEMEAKLLDREAKLQQFESQAEPAGTEKALQTLREFYQSKLKTLESEKRNLERLISENSNASKKKNTA